MEKDLILATQYGDEMKVQLKISQYLSNGCIYIGLSSYTEDGLEPYGDVTVNLREGAPDYCGYIDTNNMPELEKFLTENDIGTFTGFMGFSGFCAYPMYSFNAEKLRELCPEGMAQYEASIQPAKVYQPETGRSR